MSQVLHIDEANNLVGYLNDRHVEKVSFLFTHEIRYARTTLSYFPIAVVIGGGWGQAWIGEQLFVQITNTPYICPQIPNHAISLVRETIAQINAILAFDCKLSYKLRIFDTEIQSTR